MTSPSPAEWDGVVAQLRDAEQVALACHVSPDGDALGSMLGLAVALQGLGKQVVASWGGQPFEVPGAYRFLPAMDALVPPEDFPAAPPLLVTLDSGSADRLGSLADRADTAGCCVVIDHHASNTLFGTFNLVDATSAATAVLVAELLDRLGVELTQDIAAALYAGLVTDTGSFKYAGTTPAVHHLAADLLRTGIRHDVITRTIYDTSSFEYVRLLGAACARAELEPEAVGGLGLVWTTVEASELTKAGIGLAEIEGVIDVVRVAEEAEVALVLKGDPVDGGWKVSIRSKGAVDVGAVCTALGGGGHRFAAGFSTEDAPELVLPRLRAELAAAPYLDR